jgi:hypothetical protein
MSGSSQDRKKYLKVKYWGYPLVAVIIVVLIFLQVLVWDK